MREKSSFPINISKYPECLKMCSSLQTTIIVYKNLQETVTKTTIQVTLN